MNKVTFLPTDYQAPKTSNHYMKFQEGENKFRILSQPIIGWEDWFDKKPVRYRFENKPMRPIDPKKPVRHFWSMIVWNYNVQEIQVLHLTQATLRKSLEALCVDSDWGLPYFYDIKVMKTGEGIETEYMLNPLPHKPISGHIKDLFAERPCYLEALFDNEDPFSKDHVSFTPGIFSQDQVEVEKISMEDAYKLQVVLDECEPKYKEWLFEFLMKKYGTDNFCELPLSIYQRMYDAALKNISSVHEKQCDLPEQVDFLTIEA